LRYSDQDFEEPFNLLLQNSMVFVEDSFAVQYQKSKARAANEIEGWKVLLLCEQNIFFFFFFFPFVFEEREEYHLRPLQ